MKNQTPNQPNLLRRLLSSAVSGEPTATRISQKDLKYTLRVEDGVLHVNNVSGKPEGVMYTLMAENADGTTKLMTRYVALAPFQSFADDVEGNKVLAAWERN
jgi:hypothetical protein